MTILSKIDQKGRSMVEMLGVLAIIGVLSVGGISGYSKAMAKFKLTKAQDQMSMLLMNVRTAFATSPSYEGLNNGSAISFGIAPADMTTAVKGAVSTILSKTTKLTNAFGGEVYVSSCASGDIVSGKYTCSDDTYLNTDNTEPGQYFAISFQNLSRDACFALGGIDWGADGLMGITINGNEHTSDEFPIKLATVGSNCNSYADNVITWVYY